VVSCLEVEFVGDQALDVSGAAVRGRCMAHGTSAQASQSRASRAIAKELGTKIVSSGLVLGSPIAIGGGGSGGGGGWGGGSGGGGGVVRQSRCRCPERKQRRQRTGSRQAEARWSLARHLKHLPSVLDERHGVPPRLAALNADLHCA
jgi:hypothetical protein